MTNATLLKEGTAVAINERNNKPATERKTLNKKAWLQARAIQRATKDYKNLCRRREEAEDRAATERYKKYKWDEEAQCFLNKKTGERKYTDDQYKRIKRRTPKIYQEQSQDRRTEDKAREYQRAIKDKRGEK